MVATYINCLTVIAGALLGLLLRKHISEGFKEVVSVSAGLVTVVLGVRMALSSSNALALLFSLVAGGALGTWIRIEDRIGALGERLERRLGKGRLGGGSFAQGFMGASILFCSGAMTIVGSIQAGASGDYEVILVKSLMDGFMAVVLASVHGAGVAFSALFVLVYQGFFTLAGSFLQRLVGEAGIAEMGAVGGALLLMIGSGLLGVRRFKAGDFLPALALAPLFLRLASIIG